LKSTHHDLYFYINIYCQYWNFGIPARIPEPGSLRLIFGNSINWKFVVICNKNLSFNLIWFFNRNFSKKFKKYWLDKKNRLLHHFLFVLLFFLSLCRTSFQVKLFPALLNYIQTIYNKKQQQKCIQKFFQHKKNFCIQKFLFILLLQTVETNALNWWYWLRRWKSKSMLRGSMLGRYFDIFFFFLIKFCRLFSNLSGV
jgi:hypothetical protein